MPMGSRETPGVDAQAALMQQRSLQPVWVLELLLGTAGPGLGWGWEAGQNADTMHKGTTCSFLQVSETSGLIPVTESAWLALANCCLLKGLTELFLSLLLPFLALGFWNSETFLFLTSNQELLQPLPIEFKGLWCSLSSPAHSGKLQHRKMWAT